MKNTTFILSKFRLYVSVFALAFIFLSSCDNDLQSDGDIVNPYVVSYNPVPGVEGVSLNSNLIITFDDIVFKAQGKIHISTDVEQGNQVIDVNDDAVTLSNVNRVMTIKPKNFLPGKEYQVVLDAGFVRDSTGNLFFGMPKGETWTFKTGGDANDTDPPQLSKLTPENGAIDAGIFGLKLVFDEKITITGGDFVVYEADSDTAVQTIDSESDQVLLKDESISINFSEPLKFGENYYVQFDSGVASDLAGNAFDGITDKTMWSFKTVTGSATELVVNLPFDTDLSDISGNKFDATLGATATSGVEFVNDPDRGGVIKFNAGSYATLPTHPLLRSVTPTDDFSINFWVKTGLIGSDPIIIGNSDWGSGSNPGWLICIDNADVYPTSGKGWIVKAAPDPKGDFRFDWRASEVSPMAPTIADDQWHMVTAVFDRTNAVLHVYRDGVEYQIADQDISRLNNGPLYDVTTDYPITIWEDGTGGYNAGSQTRKNFTGFMDDLRIYNKVLTPAEINDLFNN